MNNFGIAVSDTIVMPGTSYSIILRFAPHSDDFVSISYSSSLMEARNRSPFDKNRDAPSPSFRG